MQAVLLAAGQSSRFYPFNTKHKSSFRLLGKSILEHTVLAVKEAGITDVVIVHGKDTSCKESLKDGAQLGVSIRYVAQEESLGMGDALLRASVHLQDDFFLLHPHHVDFPSFSADLLSKKGDSDAIVLLAKREEEIKRFGVLKVDGDIVTDLIEKPEDSEALSDLRIIGIYLLTKAFLQVLEHTPSEHYSFEVALAEFAKTHQAKVFITEKPHVSLKYPWELLHLSDYLLSSLKGKISEKATIADHVSIDGEVVLEDDVKVMEGVSIKGPAYIGRGSFIGNNAVIRGGVSIGDQCVIGSHMELKHSIIADRTTTHAGFIGDSVIGEDTKIAGGITTGNLRLDREAVQVKTESGPVNTQMKDLGIVMGDRVQTGIRVATMPGVIIGNDVLIGPSTTVYRNIPDKRIYYTKFQEVTMERQEGQQITSEKSLKKTDEVRTKTVLFDIDYTIFDTALFKSSNLTDFQTYDDVIETIEGLSGIAQLGIFSEGELEFQQAKLLKTKIQDLFLKDHVHIVRAKSDVLESTLSQYKEGTLFLVDDKLSILRSAKELLPEVITIWMKRGPYAMEEKNESNFEPDAVVTTLRDIIPIVAHTE